MINLKQLSKTISHALRHEPWMYELELDEEGWVPLEQLIATLRSERPKWKSVNHADIEEIIKTSSKCRFEINDGRIRAIYGHSIPEKLKRTPARPPKHLFHGTSPEAAVAIEQEGLRPMNRHNVHLSVDHDTALEVGRRKARKPLLLCVRALEASENGVPFYEGNDKVWLADDIPPQYIDFPEKQSDK